MVKFNKEFIHKGYKFNLENILSTLQQLNHENK